MKNRILVFGLVLMLICQVLCLSYENVYALDNENNKKLDLVMVLDKSGSMKDNDPDGMMKTAAKMLTAMMPVKSGCVGVIAFNQDSEEVVGLTELSDKKNVNDIINKVGKIKYKGKTDIGNAVADAVDMFDPNDDHVHAVLLLSDGKPEFGMNKNAEQQSQERLNDTLAKIKGKECYIYALGFGPEMADTNAAGYKVLKSIATSENTISTEIEPSNIHDFFVKMLLDLIGAKMPEIYDNKIPIEPNVKEANIYISSAEKISDVTIGLKTPSGDDIPLENKDDIWFLKDDFSAVIKLFDPEPGIYTLTTSRDNINITVGYVPFYDYTLHSEIVDEDGNSVKELDNGKIAEIQTCICQEEKEITDPKVYENVTASAVVTAQDTGDSTTVPLNYKDGKLRGNIKFDHVSLYTIDIRVESDTINLNDHREITTTIRPIAFKTSDSDVPPIGKKVLDKTLKKEVTLLVDNKELMAAVDDPDGVGFFISEVSSGNEEDVSAELTDDGILLTGKKWGSSLITVTYKDKLGHTLETSFTATVKDKLLIAFFAALPVLIVLLIILAIYLIMRKSRMISGNFEITRVTINHEDGDVIIIPVRKDYRARVFMGRKKTLGNGVARYAQDVYTTDRALPGVESLYRMFNDTGSIMRKNLDTIQFVGTYLGRKGCSVRIKKGSPVSMSNNRSYKQPVNTKWMQNTNFKFYSKDGAEICIEGRYIVGNMPGFSGKKAGKFGNRKAGNTKEYTEKPYVSTDDNFEDDFFS